MNCTIRKFLKICKFLSPTHPKRSAGLQPALIPPGYVAGPAQRSAVKKGIIIECKSGIEIESNIEIDLHITAAQQFRADGFTKLS